MKGVWLKLQLVEQQGTGWVNIDVGKAVCCYGDQTQRPKSDLGFKYWKRCLESAKENESFSLIVLISKECCKTIIVNVEELVGI